jgi:S1-C subfamily serine protease
MLRHALLICPLLAALLVVGAHAQQRKSPSNSAVDASQRNGAETVFASAASKVVFLITRESGEAHARASGIILTADGYIGTNYHALQGADRVEIRFFSDPADSEDYRSFGTAKLFYADAERDIAILKVNSNGLPFFACPTKTVCEARIGETVYAIGNPRGLSNTISEGIVSGIRADGDEDIIQHTAPISPGSSGGALVDSNGNLLGMNSWQVADGQNLNFAISATHLLEALEAARHATTALRFPPDAPIEAVSTTERRWNRTAIRAEFVELATSNERTTVNFWYALTNTTDADYRIDSLDEVTTAGLIGDGSLYGFNQGLSFEVPLIIPAHRQTNAILHFIPSIGLNLSIPDAAPATAVKRYKKKCNEFSPFVLLHVDGFRYLGRKNPL